MFIKTNRYNDVSDIKNSPTTTVYINPDSVSHVIDNGDKTSTIVMNAGHSFTVDTTADDFAGGKQPPK